MMPPDFLKPAVAAVLGVIGTVGSWVLAVEVSGGALLTVSLAVISAVSAVGAWMVKLLLEVRDRQIEDRGTDGKLADILSRLERDLDDHETRIRALESMR